MPYIGKSPSVGLRTRYNYTATAGQTSFSGADNSNVTLTYTDTNYTDVYLNGTLLLAVTDYTSTTGTTIVLASAASLNDILEVVVYDAFSVADTVSSVDGGTFKGNVNFSTDVDVDGTTNLDVVDIDGAFTQDGGAVFNQDSAAVNFRVESNGSANALLVDGTNNHVNIMTSTDLGAVLNVSGNAYIQHADNSDTLTLESTDADANSGPNLRMYRSSANPADADAIGLIDFEGRNDNSQDVVYAAIDTRIVDASDGSEDGRIEMATILAGTTGVSRILMDATETVFNDNSKDLDFRVESDVNANSFYLDGATGAIGLGFANTTAANQLHILGSSGVPSVNMSLQTDDTINARASITLMSRTADNTNVNAVLKNVTTGLQSSLGIMFGSDTAAANALDDYEEGNWTPTIEDSSSGEDATMNTGAGNLGTYTKIGRNVTVSAHVVVSSIGSMSGPIRLIGLPFTNVNSQTGRAGLSCGFGANLNITAGHVVAGYVELNQAFAELTIWDDAGGTTSLTAAELSADGVFFFTVTYPSA